MTTRIALTGLLVLLSIMASATGQTPTGRIPSAKELAVIQECATKYQDDVEEGERHCLFNLVATPCSNTPAGSSNLGTADCYRVEQAIWDDLLNANFKDLRGTLDDGQAAKLRDMQRAWIAYRDATCNFYYDKIQGTMAIPMAAACAARETARRALLLKFFSRL